MRRVWFALLALWGFTACGVEHGRPNVLLVTVDAVRADHVSCLGCPRQTTPRLDALASSGVLFEDAYAQSDWTLPSLASLATGLYPGHHGAVNPLWALKRDVSTLAEVLGAAGYVTAAFAASNFHDPRYGLGRGFKTYEALEPAKVQAAEISRKAIRWLSSNTASPWFLWVHYFDPHAPYLAREPWYHEFHPAAYKGKLDFGKSMDPNSVLPPAAPLSEEDRRHLLALYDSGIASADRAVATLLDAVDLTSTLVIVTSDHGEEFKEHGQIGHAISLNNELLRVPLIVAGSGVPGGARVKRTVQIIDVAPTVLELAGAKFPSAVDGRSLTSCFLGAPADPSGAAYAEQMVSSDVLTIYSLVKRPWHLIVQYARQDAKRTGAQLFDLDKDPREQSSVFDPSNPEHAELERSLGRYVESMGGPGMPSPSVAPADPARMKKLRSLGYLGSE